MINEEDIKELIDKKIKSGTKREKIIDSVLKEGLDKHCMWIFDLLLLGRSFSRIKNVLLFTENEFQSKVTELYNFLNTSDLKI